MNTPWLIEAIHPEKETVHLIRSGTGIRRKFSVPGAMHAWIEDGLLWISANTGYLWKVTPENGHRQRQRQSAASNALVSAMKPTIRPHQNTPE